MNGIDVTNGTVNGATVNNLGRARTAWDAKPVWDAAILDRLHQHVGAELERSSTATKFLAMADRPIAPSAPTVPAFHAEDGSGMPSIPAGLPLENCCVRVVLAKQRCRAEQQPG